MKRSWRGNTWERGKGINTSKYDIIEEDGGKRRKKVRDKEREGGRGREREEERERR